MHIEKEIRNFETKNLYSQNLISMHIFMHGISIKITGRFTYKSSILEEWLKSQSFMRNKKTVSCFSVVS